MPEYFDIESCLEAMKDEMEWQMEEWKQERLKELFEYWEE